MKKLINVVADLLDSHPINKIYWNHPERLESLIADIKENGILTPLLVIHNGERYLIISGHSRFYAGKANGISEFPVIVTEIDPENIEYTVVASNNNRVKFPSEIAKELPIVKTHHARRSGERTELNGEAAHNTRKLVAKYFNMSEGQVEKYESISKTCPELFNQIDHKELSIEQAYQYSKKLEKGEDLPNLSEKTITQKECCSECNRPLTQAMINKRNQTSKSNES